MRIIMMLLRLFRMSERFSRRGGRGRRRDRF
jgi:hypothetical protein